MRAKTKTVFKGFDYMHCDDFAKYLGDMAAKGWHFKEWGAGLKFEKGEPEQTTYAVEVFMKASENDMRPEPQTQEFAEYCKAAGWKFIDAKQKFCIFKKIDACATELFTQEERINNALKGMWSGSAITILVLSGLNAVLRWGNLYSIFKMNIFSDTFFFGISVWTIMFFYQLLTLLYAAWKCRKLKKVMQTSEKIYIGNRQDGKYHLNIKDVYILLLIVLLMYYFYVIDRVGLVILNVGIIVVTIGFSVIMNKIRPEHDTNVMIQVVFSILLILSIFFFTLIIVTEGSDDSTLQNDNAPLVIMDYRECDDVIKDTSYYGERNLLGSRESYFVFGEEYSLHYDMYQSEYAWILDKIWKDELEGKKYNEEVVDCTADWGAQKALQNKTGTYYVRYEDAVLVFDDFEEVYLTIDQINIIRDKLDLR